MSNQVYSSFSVGGVLSSSFSLIKNNFAFFGTALLLSVVATFLYNMLYLQLMGVNDLQSLQVSPDFSFGSIITMLVVYLIGISLYSIMVLDGSLTLMKGQETNFSDHMANGFKLLIPMLGLGIFYTSYMIFGFIILIIPGLIIMVTYYICYAVKVSEGIGVFASMTRSKELTKGHRWGIFALFLIPYIIYTVITSGIAGFAFFGADGDINAMLDVGIGTQIINALLYALYLTFNVVIIGVTYKSLVGEKEGGDVDSVSQVFS